MPRQRSSNPTAPCRISTVGWIRKKVSSFTAIRAGAARSAIMCIGGRTFSKPVVDVPAVWRNRFGDSAARRNATTVLGGLLILFASRLAGGCTLGLFISGSTQLALSGLYFGVLLYDPTNLGQLTVTGLVGNHALALGVVLMALCAGIYLISRIWNHEPATH
ncbi:MAG: YeeE/YedE family protein [Desulfosarcina sp.]|nr:YeeE/YedE family protein [Desulfosarcina sp.]